MKTTITLSHRMYLKFHHFSIARAVRSRLMMAGSRAALFTLMMCSLGSQYDAVLLDMEVNLHLGSPRPSHPKRKFLAKTHGLSCLFRETRGLGFGRCSAGRILQQIRTSAIPPTGGAGTTTRAGGTRTQARQPRPAAMSGAPAPRQARQRCPLLTRRQPQIPPRSRRRALPQTRPQRLRRIVERRSRQPQFRHRHRPQARAP